MNFLIGCRVSEEVVYFAHMQFPRILRKKKTFKRRVNLYEDSLRRLGNEQFRKMMERGTKIPVASI